MALNNLGVSYLSLGEYKKAEPLFKQSLEIYKKIFGNGLNCLSFDCSR